MNNLKDLKREVVKRKLCTFGDSFTESYLGKKGSNESKYIDWKGYPPKVYGEVIADELELELINLGKGGSDNYSIFQTICDSVHLINSDDIIIIGWSLPTRFRLVNKKGKWMYIIPNFNINDIGLEHISDTTITEILLNRGNKLYEDEVRSWIKLLNHAFPNNLLIHWSWINNKVTPNYFGDISTIQTETNGEVNDGHYGEEGHNQLAKKLINMILTNTNQIIRLI